MNQIDKETSVRPDASINPRQRGRSQARRGLLALLLGCALLATVGATPAMASFSVSSFSNTLINQDMTLGHPGRRAPLRDGHEHRLLAAGESGAPTENVKDVAVGLPPGLIGNPNATPRCPVTPARLEHLPSRRHRLASLTVTLNVGGGDSPISEPLYNVVPPAGMPAQFGANILLVNAYLDVSVRTGSDYGLTTTTTTSRRCCRSRASRRLCGAFRPIRRTMPSGPAQAS